MGPASQNKKGENYAQSTLHRSLPFFYVMRYALVMKRI